MRLYLLLGLCLLFSCAKTQQNQEEKAIEVYSALGLVELVSQDSLLPFYEPYFELKDALVESDEAKAKAIAEAYQTKLNTWLGDTTAKDISKNLAAIAKTALKAQRVHFYGLSIQMETILKSYQDSSRNAVYLQYCPMAFNNTGASWLSKEKNILNPYFGDKMLTCGMVKGEL